MNSKLSAATKKLLSEKSTTVSTSIFQSLRSGKLGRSGRLLNTRFNQTVSSRTFLSAHARKNVSFRTRKKSTFGVDEFISIVMQHYKQHGRHDLPWRPKASRSGTEDIDPYKILVSEMMLQQTQVPRVIPKYEAFLERFPTAVSLAHAELGEVYRLWQGLGYNRRARFLRDTARTVCQHPEAKLPDTIEDLEALPGIGPYTARAVYTFAYNKPCVLIETNVRACVLHHFFPTAKKGSVSDVRIEKIMRACMEVVVNKQVEPRVWYSALMDYGTFLKSQHTNPSRKSRTHVVQKKFKGSVREVRGEILRILSKNRHQTRLTSVRQQTTDALQATDEKFNEAVAGLVKDGLVVNIVRGWLKLAE